MADDKRVQNYTELLKTKTAELRNREKMWHALKDYIHSAGGWATSSQGDSSYMRAEILPNSEIPIRLAERGLRLNYIGSGATRNTSAGIVPVDVIEIVLGK
jgi:hypothetical protein